MRQRGEEDEIGEILTETTKSKRKESEEVVGAEYIKVVYSIRVHCGAVTPLTTPLVAMVLLGCS